MESHDDIPWWPAGPIEQPVPVADLSAEPRGKQRRRGASLSSSFIAGILGALLTMGALAGTGLIEIGSTEEPPVSVSGGDGQAAKDLSTLAAEALPSIARVVVATNNEVGEAAAFATGSAVGFSSEGHLVTNAHVVAGADVLRVELIDGRTVSAELIGFDALTDVAVIKIPAGFVPPIALGVSAEVSIGDTAVAVGNPLGLEGGPSVTAGVVSAFGRQLSIADRDLPALVGLIQTDAPISGGSSGGALLNARGELIGITTAKSSGDNTEGLGFAIPVDLVENIARTLISNGKVDHPFLGILGTTFTEELADGSVQPSGAIIGGILQEDGTYVTLDASDAIEIEGNVHKSAFGEAGARLGDVIVAFDGTPIRTMNQLAALMRYYRAGDSIAVDLIRDGGSLTISVTLDTRPEGI